MLSDKNLSRLIVISISYTLVVIFSMHFLQPNKDPAVNAISEFATGPFGGLMTTTFFAQSFASMAVAIVVLRMEPKKPKVIFSGILFILAALGDVLAGLYQTDPTVQTELTTTGTIHMIGGMTRFFSLAIGLPLLSAVLKKNEQQPNRVRILYVLAMFFLVIFMVTLFFLAPNEMFGLGQRLFIGTALVWMILFARVVGQDSK